MTFLRKTTAALVGALALAVPATAGAAGTSDWTQVGRSTLSIEYFQGITHDDRGHVFFDGPTVGVYRTDTKLKEQARNPDVIGPEAKANPGFNHMGDLTWDRAEGGRLILPLECYDPSKSPSNTCGVGGFGVADPATLQWKYWVKLDPADIAKAMWAEVSPDGKLIWTSSGNDLLAYSTSDVVPANAQPSGAVIRPVKRLVGAVPAQGITGAVFVGPKLLVAGQQGAKFTVSSIDLTSGKSTTAIQETINGESEGLDTFTGVGGTLHWMVTPISQTGPATFTPGKTTLLNYKARPTALDLTVTPRKARAGKRTRFTFRVADDNGDPVKGATVSFARARARTNSRGRASVTVALRGAGRYTAVAKKKGLKTARALVRSSR